MAGTRSRALLSLVLLSMVGGQAVAQDSGGCDVYAPTPAEFLDDVEGSDRIFIGRVMAFRMDDTTLAEATPDCPLLGGNGASEECAAFWSRVVSVHYLIEAPIKGVEDQRTFESTWLSTTDPCNGFKIGQLWLFSGHGYQRIQLAEMPSMAVLASLRQRVKD